jgi:hypothetical protein
MSRSAGFRGFIYEYPLRPFSWRTLRPPRVVFVIGVVSFKRARGQPQPLPGRGRDAARSLARQVGQAWGPLPRPVGRRKAGAATFERRLKWSVA